MLFSKNLVELPTPRLAGDNPPANDVVLESPEHFDTKHSPVQTHMGRLNVSSPLLSACWNSLQFSGSRPKILGMGENEDFGWVKTRTQFRLPSTVQLPATSLRFDW
jgi:hypothetical protein